jgi:hypothetical protein
VPISPPFSLDSRENLVVLGRRRRRRENNESQAGEDIYHGLRTMALGSVEQGLALPSSEHADVSGMVVDIPSGGGFATVVALTDNTASMYTSAGGGTIGAGEHQAVAEAVHGLLSVVQAQLGSFKRHDDGSLPPAGNVRFHVLTPSALRVEDVSEDSFWGRAPSDLTPVIASVQNLVTAIREASPG